MADFINYLGGSLSKPLPGQDKQAEMMPSLSDKSRFSLEAKKDAKDGGVMILFYQKKWQLAFSAHSKARL